LETTPKPSFDNQERELNSKIGCLAIVIKIDEGFSNYFIWSPMAIEEARRRGYANKMLKADWSEVANDFRSNREKENEVIECLV